MRKSFSLRLGVAFAVVGIASAALTAIVVNVAFERSFADYAREQLGFRERQIATALAESYAREGGWEPDALDVVSQMVSMDGGTLRLSDRKGRTVWDVPSTAAEHEIVELHRQILGTGELGPERRLPVRVDGRDVGSAAVRLPTPGLHGHDRAFRSAVNRFLLFAAIIGGAVALGFGLLLARRAVRPATQLATAARAIAAGDRERRVRLDSPDEFGEMARAFDRMADALADEDRLRREFAADVAHELRTPIAILRSHLEGIQDGVVQPTPEAIGSLHEEVVRLGRHVADLEVLASAQAASFTITREPCALQSIIAEVADQISDVSDRHPSIELELADVTAWVDPVRFRQIVWNLLSNALRITPEGARVDVRLAVEDGSAVVDVTDRGPGIPAGEIDRIFERFYRGSTSPPGGSGIGLTVARELARAHQGDVAVTSRPGQGATFTVRLPLEPADTAVFTSSSRGAGTFRDDPDHGGDT